jgi:NitT/TauT family transport system ATP-binding protein
MANDVIVHQLRKRVNGADLYDNLTFTAKEGTITALFGPNGCGKSTLLNVLAGVASKDGGTTSSDGISRAEFSYLFQSYRESLLPWRTNERNLSFPLELRGKGKDEIQARTQELCRTFDIDFDMKRHPYELSGGQQQTLALLRALVTEPSVLFMDEPFSALDYENTIRMRERLQNYYVRKKPTVLFISHDIEEAVHMASSIIVLSQRPTRVVEVIQNPAPYPRTVEVLNSEEFHLIKNRVLTAFKSATHL